MTDKWLWFDMDGTIADLYGVENWLEDVRAFNARPYKVARPLYNMDVLHTIIAELKNIGWHVGIISWLSKEPEVRFDNEVILAKNEWLKRQGLADLCDEVIVCSHGLRKSDICGQFCHGGILVDDEEKNRQDWNLGGTIDARKNILYELAKLRAGFQISSKNM